MFPDFIPLLKPLQDWLLRNFPEARLLIVGGSVRDALRGHPSKDLDLEIIGVEPARLLEALPWDHRTVGRSFSHQLLRLPDLGWVELSLEERDEWEQLCRRRDFTCNAIAWDVERQELIDPLGGSQDIQARLLQPASPQSLQEDPLRVWRAAQFCARFEWQVSAQIDSAVADCLPALPDLPSERVTREWEKLLTLPERPSLALIQLDRWGVVDLCYPELAALKGCLQDPEYHPEGDVWTHTLLVLDQAARLGRERNFASEERLQLCLAALLHDVGKPATTAFDGERITAYGHEHAGMVPASAWLRRHSFSEATCLAVLDCVDRHMRPGQLYKDIEAGRLSPSQQVNALRRLLKDLKQVSWEVFIALCEADKGGRGQPLEDFAPGRVLSALLQQQPVQSLARQTLLRGRDLLELGLSPGPAVGEWIARAEEARDHGLIATREEALDWFRTQILDSPNLSS